MYDESGLRITQSQHNNPWQFASKRFDAETSFVYFSKRYYAPDLDRWITPDPLGFADGPNLYAYVHSSPMTKFDLYGLFAHDDAHDPHDIAHHFGWIESFARNGVAMLSMIAAGSDDQSIEEMMRSYAEISSLAQQPIDAYRHRLAEQMTTLYPEVSVSQMHKAIDGGALAADVVMIGTGVVGIGKTTYAGAKNWFGPAKSESAILSRSSTLDVSKQTLNAPSPLPAHNSSLLSSINAVQEIPVTSKIRPDPNAVGAHSVFRRNPETQKITHYETYIPQTNLRNPLSWQGLGRYDGPGDDSHWNKVFGKNIEAPHVHDPASPGGVRPALPHEIPK